MGATSAAEGAPPPPGRVRILCLGESTTATTAPIDFSWPAQLQGILDKSLGHGAVSVINAGRSATNTNAILIRLPGLLERYQPQVVVAMMGVNDPEWYGIAPKRGWWASAFYALRVVRAARYLFHESSKALRDAPPDEDDPRWTKAIAEAGLLSRLGRFDRARAVLEPVLKIPGLSAHFREVTRAFRQFGDQRAAAQADLLAAGASSSQSRYGLEWDRLTSEMRYREADALTRRVLRRSPKDHEALRLLANSLMRQERFDEAQAALDASLANAPKDWAVRRALLPALIAKDLRSGRLEEARRKEEGFNRESGAGPDSADNLSQDEWLQEKLMQFEMKAGRTAAAERRLERITGEPTVAVAELPELEVTKRNELKLREILQERGIRFFAMQYPRRDPRQLEKIFEPAGGVSIIDNRVNFNRELDRLPAYALFIDLFAGDFGHCTARGNELIARNVARRLQRDGALRP